MFQRLSFRDYIKFFQSGMQHFKCHVLLMLLAVHVDNFCFNPAHVEVIKFIKFAHEMVAFFYFESAICRRIKVLFRKRSNVVQL